MANDDRVMSAQAWNDLLNEVARVRANLEEAQDSFDTAKEAFVGIVEVLEGLKKPPIPAYLIDPFEKTVTQVEYDHDYKSIYGFIQADCFDVVRFSDENDTAFVDDAGLYKEGQQFWAFSFQPGRPLAGRALVLGTNAEGESVQPSMSLEQLTEVIRFTSLEEVKKAADNGAYSTTISTLGPDMQPGEVLSHTTYIPDAVQNIDDE